MNELVEFLSPLGGGGSVYISQGVREMNKFTRRSLRWREAVLLSVLSAASLCGCSTIKPHLSDDEVRALRSVPTTIMYVEPSKSLYTYMRGMEDNPGVPGDSSVLTGVTFGLGAGIASEIVYEKQAKDYYAFQELFNRYNKTVDALGVSKATYETARKALSAVPWYQNVEWKLLPASNDSDFYHESVQLTNSQVVIFISPLALIRTDAEVVRADCRISIWVKNPNNRYDVHLYDSEVIGYEKKIYPGNEHPSDKLEDAFDDLGMNQRLNDIFSNNGELFQQTFSAILTKLQARLTFYFMGTSNKADDASHER